MGGQRSCWHEVEGGEKVRGKSSSRGIIAQRVSNGGESLSAYLRKPNQNNLWAKVLLQCANQFVIGLRKLKIHDIGGQRICWGEMSLLYLHNPGERSSPPPLSCLCKTHSCCARDKNLGPGMRCAKRMGPNSKLNNVHLFVLICAKQSKIAKTLR